MLPNSSSKFLERPKHALDVRSQREVVKKVNSLLNGKIVDDKGNVIGRFIYADGNVTLQFKASGGAGKAYIDGEWDPAKSYPDTTQGTQAIVFFAPDGQSAGTYYNLQTVPAGTSPDVGFPYWASFPNAAPGQWM